MKTLLKTIAILLVTTTIAKAESIITEPMIHPPQVIINPLHACEGEGLQITATERGVKGVQQVTVDYVRPDGEVINGRLNFVVENTTVVKGPHALTILSGKSYAPIACHPMHPCPDMSSPFTLILEHGTATFISESAPADRRITTKNRLKCSILL